MKVTLIVFLLFPVLANVVARLNDNNNDDNSTAAIESRLDDVHDDETLALANVSNPDYLDAMLLSKADTRGTTTVQKTWSFSRTIPYTGPIYYNKVVKVSGGTLKTIKNVNNYWHVSILKDGYWFGQCNDASKVVQLRPGMSTSAFSGKSLNGGYNIVFCVAPVNGNYNSQTPGVLYLQLTYTKKTSSGGGGGWCFSPETPVMVKDKGFVPMKDLSLNDEVLATADGGFSKVYAFGNRNADQDVLFSRIQTASTTIDMTPDHMIYLADKSLPVPAFSLKPGDVLRTVAMPGAKNKTLPNVVLDVSTVVLPGFATPVTASGTIVVGYNGVLASSYAGKHNSANYFGVDKDVPSTVEKIFHYHSISHAVVAPLRFVCTAISPWFCSWSFHYPEDSEAHPGQHHFFAMVHSLKHFVKSEACGPVLHAFLFAIVVGMGIVFSLLESITFMATLIAVVVGCKHFFKGGKKTVN